MKITRVSAHYLRLPDVTTRCDGTQDTCLIQIETDAGITGWGEVDSAPTVVKAVVEAPLSHQISNGLANALVGLDPLAIDVCGDRMLGRGQLLRPCRRGHARYGWRQPRAVGHCG